MRNILLVMNRVLFLVLSCMLVACEPANRSWELSFRTAGPAFFNRKELVETPNVFIPDSNYRRFSETYMLNSKGQGVFFYQSDAPGQEHSFDVGAEVASEFWDTFPETELEIYKDEMLDGNGVSFDLTTTNNIVIYYLEGGELASVSYYNIPREGTSDSIREFLYDVIMMSGNPAGHPASTND